MIRRLFFDRGHKVVKKEEVSLKNQDGIYDITILGAGPAGLTAGVYSARKKLKTLLLSSNVGGQASQSSDIENYPGFTMITGADLAKKFVDHLGHYEVDFKEGVEIRSVKIEEYGFMVTADREYRTKTIIIASGKTARFLNVPGEKELKGRGVTYCATCDAPLFHNKDVAVIGGGNSALDAVLQLTKIANKVYLINKNEDYSTADQIMLGKIKKAENVEILTSKDTLEVLGEKIVDGLKIKDWKSNKETVLKLEGIFVEIGSVPSTGFLRGLVKLNENGEIIIDKKNMTSIPGIFAAGDVTDIVEKQIIVAAGEGCKASLMASEYLAKKEEKIQAPIS